MRKTTLLFVLAILAAVLMLSGCSKSDAEDAASEAGLNMTFSEGDIGVETPAGWHFMFGITLDEGQSELLDKNFAIDLSFLDSYIDFDEIEQMIAIAKVEDLEGYGKRLRYANKLIVRDEALQLDTESLDKLGDSIGSAGEGLYAAYYAETQNGYIHGRILDCESDPLQDALATISGGPFFTYSSDDGTWALPTLGGVPAAVNLTGNNCVCAVAAPSTNTADDPNPKANTGEGDTPGSSTFEDNTYVVEAADCVCCPPQPISDDDAADDAADDVTDDAADDTADDDTADDTTDDDVADDTTDDDAADDTVPDDDVTDDDAATDCVDFEDGSLAGWSFSSECSFFGNSAEAYDTLFEAGDQTRYLFLSSGGNQAGSCTMTYTVTVPAGATMAEISYNFVSQEYAEWVGSAYNDIFTVILQGAPDYLVNRTVNNVATDNDWFDIPTDSPAATIAGIASSQDAQYNPGPQATPWSNGPYKFDGMLDWSADAELNPRGNPYDMNRGKTSTVALPEDMSTVTIIATVSDVGDKIYDSVGLIDWVCFK